MQKVRKPDFRRIVLSHQNNHFGKSKSVLKRNQKFVCVWIKTNLKRTVWSWRPLRMQWLCLHLYYALVQIFNIMFGSLTMLYSQLDLKYVNTMSTKCDHISKHIKLLLKFVLFITNVFMRMFLLIFVDLFFCIRKFLLFNNL